MAKRKFSPQPQPASVKLLGLFSYYRTMRHVSNDISSSISRRLYHSTPLQYAFSYYLTPLTFAA